MSDTRIYTVLVFCTLMNVYFLIHAISSSFTPIFIIYPLVYIVISFSIILYGKATKKNHPRAYYFIYTTFLVTTIWFFFEHRLLVGNHWEEVWRYASQLSKSRLISYSLGLEESYLKNSFFISLVSFLAMLFNLVIINDTTTGKEEEEKESIGPLMS